MVECTFPRLCPGKTTGAAPLSGEFSSVAVAGKQGHGGLVAQAACRRGRNFRQERIAGGKPGIAIGISAASVTVFSLADHRSCQSPRQALDAPAARHMTAESAASDVGGS